MHRAANSSMAFSSPPVVSTTAERPRMAEITYSVATACFWLRPMSMSRWWMWPRSACMGLWPWAMRRMKAKVVSKMGRPKIRKGTTKVMTA